MTKIHYTDVSFTIAERLGNVLALNPSFPFYVYMLHALKNIATHEGLSRELHVFSVNNNAVIEKGE